MDFPGFVFLSYVKILLVLLSAILSGYLSYCQDTKKEPLPCSCSSTVYVKYPDVDEEDELEGTVIAEYEIDSVCFASNPRIIQSLGTAFDKEALRVVNLMISLNNRCFSKCKPLTCEKKKVKFPLTFKKPD